MGAPAIGAVVTLAFPYSDLQGTKNRPALVLADAGRGDWVLCQITSQAFGDPNIVALHSVDFSSGALSLLSYARPLKLFTAHESLFKSNVAQVNISKISEVKQQLTRLLLS
jgi:mRNA interferase MazF